MRNVTISKFVVFALTLTVTAFAVREASAEQISQANATAICNKVGGLLPAGLGTSCFWCSKQGLTKHCYTINCGGGVYGCEFTVVSKGTNPPPNHRPVGGAVPPPRGSFNPPKGTKPVGVGGVKAPNSGVNQQPGGSNQPVTIERNNTEPSGGGGGGGKR
jgi:hypothetical protein